MISKQSCFDSAAPRSVCLFDGVKVNNQQIIVFSPPLFTTGAANRRRHFFSLPMAQPLHLTITVDVLASEVELTPAEATVWQAARAATDHAYAPYSHFHVGAALLLADGTVFRGTNQENAAYPSGLCAERTALFGLAASQPPQRIMGMAVAARPARGEFTLAWPCGACRQVMVEYEQRQQHPIALLLPGPDGTIYRFRSLGDLMPFSFSADILPNSSAVA